MKFKRKDCFSEYDVSTVYAPDVELYETMIVYPNKYVLAQRYKTETEAKKGHLEVIENLKSGKIYDGKDELFESDPIKNIIKFIDCLNRGKYNQ